MTYYACPLCERRTDHGDYVSIDACHDSRTGIGRTLHALVRHRVWMTSRTIEREFNRKWGDLARYNDERSRGIVHDPAYVSAMAEKQAAYDRKGEER